MGLEELVYLYASNGVQFNLKNAHICSFALHMK